MKIYLEIDPYLLSIKTSVEKSLLCKRYSVMSIFKVLCGQALETGFVVFLNLM